MGPVFREWQGGLGTLEWQKEKATAALQQIGPEIPNQACARDITASLYFPAGKLLGLA